jgi:hypothetical protein
MNHCHPRVVPLRFDAAPQAQTLPATSEPAPKAVFEYLGEVPLTVIGPASGLRYRFEGAGARLAVDPRDRASLAALPLLKAREGRPLFTLV